MRAHHKHTDTTLSLADLLRDPTSEDEWRHTIAAWTTFLERHLTSQDTELREMAVMTLLKRGAALLHLQDDRSALADIEQVLALQPPAYTVYKAYELRATLFSSLGKELEALDDWTQTLARCQALPPGTISAEERAQLSLERGKCFARLNRHQEAIADFLLTLQIDAACAESHCWLGLSSAYLGETTLALSSCNRALELHPKQASFLHIRGVVHRIFNHFEEALTDLDLAIKQDPENAAMQQDRRHTVLKAGLMLEHPSAAAVFANRSSLPFAQSPQKSKDHGKEHKKRKQTALRDQHTNTFF